MKIAKELAKGGMLRSFFFMKVLNFFSEFPDIFVQGLKNIFEILLIDLGKFCRFLIQYFVGQIFKFFLEELG